MKLIPRDLFAIAEDFDLDIYEDSDGVIGVCGSLQNFTGFMMDLAIRCEQSGNAQLAFDLAKAVEFENGEDSFSEFFDFPGYQFV